MTSAPTVSIGMPVYNGEKHLPSALNSLLAQTFADFELIISDNASTDGTQSICREYAGRDRRIRYFRQGENRGGNANFQFVLDQARGAYFMWASHDDKREPAFIERLWAVLGSHDDFACVMSDVQNLSDDDADLGITCLDSIRVEKVQEHWDSVRLLFFENPTTQIFFSVYGLFRTSILRQVSITYHGRLRHIGGSEIPLLAQIATRGKIASISDVLMVYRRREDSAYHTELKRMSFVARLDGLGNVSACLARIALVSDMSPPEVGRALTTILRTGSNQVVQAFVRDLPRASVRRLLVAAGAAEIAANGSLLIKHGSLRALRSAVRRLWGKS